MNHLSHLELHILSIICTQNGPISTRGIRLIDNTIKKPTLHKCIARLLDAEIIEVAYTEVEVKVPSRFYVPTKKAKQIILEHIFDLYLPFSTVISKEEFIKAIQEL